jgi:hypothetical protein
VISQVWITRAATPTEKARFWVALPLRRVLATGEYFLQDSRCGGGQNLVRGPKGKQSPCPPCGPRMQGSLYWTSSNRQFQLISGSGAGRQTAPLPNLGAKTRVLWEGRGAGGWLTLRLSHLSRFSKGAVDAAGGCGVDRASRINVKVKGVGRSV